MDELVEYVFLAHGRPLSLVGPSASTPGGASAHRPHGGPLSHRYGHWLATPTFHDDVHVHTHCDAEVRVFRVPPSYNSVDGMLCKALWWFTPSTFAAYQQRSSWLKKGDVLLRRNWATKLAGRRASRTQVPIALSSWEASHFPLLRVQHAWQASEVHVWPASLWYASYYARDWTPGRPPKSMCGKRHCRRSLPSLKIS